ncbi:MAG: tetratricopeptide repeat protein [Myxococcota bacterium]
MAKKRRRRPLSSLRSAEVQTALDGIGRGGDAAAIPVLRRILAAHPDHAPAAHGLGLALLHQGQAQEAKTWLSQAYAARPEDPDVVFAWAFLHYSTYRPREAVRILRELLEVHPAYARARPMLGDALRMAGDKEGALAVLEEADATSNLDSLGTLLALRAEVCAWPHYEDNLRRLVAGLTDQLDAGRSPSLHPFGAIKLGLPAELVRRLARNRVPFTSLEAPQESPPPHAPATATGRLLRVGYLSDDLHDHPVGLLLAPILEAHSPDVEARAYAPRRIDDAVRRRIEAAVPVVGLEGLDDSAAAERVRGDQLDVLIDTIGFTNSARAGLLARHPALRTAHWLGYPGSMPRSLVDAQITTAARLGPRGARDYDERLVLLPETFVASEGFGSGPQVPPRAELGLPPDRFVFGFFGAAYRIEPSVLSAWAQILDAVPDAVMWIQLDHERTRGRLRDAFQARGVDPERVLFAAEGPLSKRWHHTRADLWLDGWKLSSGTASIVAMWTGTPLLTLAGRAPPARTGIGVLTGMGMAADLVVDSGEAYVERAIELARAPHELRRIRALLAAQRGQAPLFDVPRFVLHLEDALRQVRALPARSQGAPIEITPRPSQSSAA